MVRSREGAFLSLRRMHAWFSGGCMLGSREGPCQRLGWVHAWVSVGCMPGSREGACLGLDRLMYTEKNKEKKKSISCLTLRYTLS